MPHITTNLKKTKLSICANKDRAPAVGARVLLNLACTVKSIEPDQTDRVEVWLKPCGGTLTELSQKDFQHYRFLPSPHHPALDRRALRIHFIRKGDSMRAWAQRHGYSYRSTYAAARGERRGMKSIQIVAALAEEMRRAA